MVNFSVIEVVNFSMDKHNLKTHFVHVRGESFYGALTEACAGDARLMEEEIVRDGKFHGYYHSPTYVRQPWVWRLWELISPGGGQGIVVWSIIASAAVLMGTYWAFERHVGQRAAFIPMLMFPALLVHTTWSNVFFPTWWATLFLFASIVFVARGWPTAAAAMAIAAAFMRFMALPMFAIIIVLVGVRAIKQPEWRKVVAACGVMLAAFAVAYAFHYSSAAEIIVAEAASPGRESLLGSGLQLMGRSFEKRLLAATSYLMFPYGFLRVPGLLALPLGIAGFWTMLNRDRFARSVLTLYVLVWTVFLVIVGASSSYWGMLIMPVALLGIALLVCGLDYLVLNPKAWGRSAGEAT